MTNSNLRATLIGDGTSDRALVHVLDWLFKELHVAASVQYADLSVVAKAPSKLRERAIVALKLFPAELLFVHRDAEGEHPDVRYDEISLSFLNESLCYVPIVPVRMTEAWFLFDESAIRTAAGNPNGTISLKLPPLQRVESIPDPKAVLNTAILDATGKNSRRRSTYRTGRAYLRVAELISDFRALRRLDTFQRLETETARNVEKILGSRAS
jgi:hypothetical protein